MDAAVNELVRKGWKKEEEYNPPEQGKEPRQVLSKGDRRAYITPCWVVFYEKGRYGIELQETVKVTNLAQITRVALSSKGCEGSGSRNTVRS